jgi:FMN-dependent NADH-azoreductase
MAKLLNVVCELKPEEKSPGLYVASEFLREYLKWNPRDEIHTVDLYRDPIQRIDADVLSGWEKIKQGQAFATLADDEQRKIGRIWKLADQFIDADKYVFVTPAWDLGFPAEFKMYIDTICVIGKTFRYTPNGPEGLLKNNGKKCLHFYGLSTAHQKEQVDNEVSYFSFIMNFMGVEEVESIVVRESVPNSKCRRRSFGNAMKKAIEVATRF